MDLWAQNETYDGPAIGMNNTYSKCNCDNGDPYPVTASGTPIPASECTFEDSMFLDFVLDTIEQHDLSKPMFVFWAAHTIHAPLQVSQAFTMTLLVNRV